LGDLGRDDLTEGHAAGAEDVLHHVQALDDLGPALGEDLAALPGHQASEVVGLALDELGEVVEQLGPVDTAGTAPGRVGGAGGGDGPVGVVGRAERESADDRGEVAGAVAREGLAAGGPLPGDEVTTSNGRPGRAGHGAPPWCSSAAVVPAGRRGG